MTTVKVKFFTMSAYLSEKIGEYYRSEDMFFTMKKENYFDHLFEVRVASGKESVQLIPPFAASNFAGMGGDDLEGFLKGIAIERKVTVSVAESCSGGLVANRITNVPGSSAYFLGGVVAYSDSMKVSILGVQEDSISSYGAVSPTVASEMAEGAARITGSDYAVSITGIAGPDGGTKEKPVGTVWFGIRTPNGMERKRIQFTGTREEIKCKVSSFAIFDLIKTIRTGRSL